ncbi:molecular chaperone [Pantoea ananatis]|uniref:fimbrial biogenesis chaperone n=1 Tax=Pantoea ananas TaxID=553 RepID=UPI0015898D1A|nr:molecular chaperone [Pantoea ananatis]MBA4823476.1 molecular chaperone [Pantoea ananatis]QKV88020.1 molecular chaperone [Pantoea ananatis]
MLRFYSLFFIAVMSTKVYAGIEIGGSRVIFDEKNGQAAISINNPDLNPYLVQSWISKNISGDDDDNTFIVTPPLFRLESKTQNSVRVIYTGKPLPADRESMFWLSIKSIPSTSKQASNQLLITVKTVMKFFYRPAGLKNDPLTAYRKLIFKYKNGNVEITNPTPFNISFYEIKVGKSEIKAPQVLAPYSTYEIPCSLSEDRTISWKVINDFGGTTDMMRVKV